MEEENVFKAKTVDDALELGLETLGLTLDEVDYEVLEEGKRRLIGSVKAAVKIIPKKGKVAKTTKTADSPATKKETKKFDKKPAADKKPAERRAGTPVDPVAFCDGLLKLLEVEGSSTLTEGADGTVIEIKTQSSARIIGKHGDVLDAIQCIVGAVANIGNEEYKKVIVDCENYRAQREQTLKDLAAKVANKAVETGRKILIEPMSPYERRVIHSALSENSEVKTASEGREPDRYVVVIPKNARPNDRGIRYGRGHGDDRRRDNRRDGGRGDRRFNDRRRDSRPAGGAKSGKKEIRFGTFLGNSNEKPEE